MDVNKLGDHQYTVTVESKYDVVLAIEFLEGLMLTGLLPLTRGCLEEERRKLEERLRQGWGRAQLEGVLWLAGQEPPKVGAAEFKERFDVFPGRKLIQYELGLRDLGFSTWRMFERAGGGRGGGLFYYLTAFGVEEVRRLFVQSPKMESEPEKLS